MGWVVAYLLSAFICPAFYVGFLVSGSENFDIRTPDDVLQAVCFCLLWPVFIGVQGTEKIIENRKRYHKERHKQIVGMYSLDRLRSLEDRSIMVSIPEGDLKFLLKAHRKGKIDIGNGLFTMVRDELMNRMTERCLFK